ncbi:DUF2793 domain-containing protein [Ponticoccus gilvus]|nr:DUF2793 domain-containing protein [Enemella evansiae]
MRPAPGQRSGASPCLYPFHAACPGDHSPESATDRSARLSLPYLHAAQAQKHVTHNEALALLDLAVQLSVEAFDASEPPATPAPGQAWALAAGATGAWAGQAAGTLAVWTGEAWRLVPPGEGWVATRRGTAEQRVFGPSSWGRSWPKASAPGRNPTGRGRCRSPGPPPSRPRPPSPACWCRGPMSGRRRGVACS